MPRTDDIVSVTAQSSSAYVVDLWSPEGDPTTVATCRTEEKAWALALTIAGIVQAWAAV
jgi:hypothetical protein